MENRRARALAEMAERRRERLRSTLLGGEAILAEGRTNWLGRGEEPRGGSTHAYLWITDRRLTWCDVWGLHAPHTLPLEAITSYDDQMFDTHRYALTLHHRPATRVEWAPRWHLLRWSWGNRRVPRERRHTRFAFSRAGTHLAEALRRELRRRGLPARRLPPRPSVKDPESRAQLLRPVDPLTPPRGPGPLTWRRP